MTPNQTAPLVGIVKELAPTKQAENDTVLGVGAFQEEYFGGKPLFLDEERRFYDALGSRKIFTLKTLAKALWSPRKTYREVKALGARLEREQRVAVAVKPPPQLERRRPRRPRRRRAAAAAAAAGTTCG